MRWGRCLALGAIAVTAGLACETTKPPRAPPVGRIHIDTNTLHNTEATVVWLVMRDVTGHDALYICAAGPAPNIVDAAKCKVVIEPNLVQHSSQRSAPAPEPEDRTVRDDVPL